MDASMGPCLTDSVSQQEPAELPSKSASPTRPDSNGAPMLTVPEDDDEPWSDAHGTSTGHEETSTMQGGVWPSHGGNHAGSASSVPVSAIDTLLDTAKDIHAKGASQTSVAASVEESPSAVVGADDAHVREQQPSPASLPLSVSHVPSALPLTNNAQSMSSPDLPSSCVSAHASSATVQSQSGSNLEQRRNRRRSAIDSFSANRFSGFWQNIINRRPERNSSNASFGNARKARDVSNAREEISKTSITSIRATPPPALPAPSLQDLGLSLTALTPILTTTHLNSAPTSGTFLAPHYLLLCHAQGLDVLPLVSPPSPQPYALVRKVGFKNVVVMEEKGVLIAIAGRRDVVRVYALEEIRKAINWRLDVEIRREKDRLRRDQAKRVSGKHAEAVFGELATNYTEDKPFKGVLTDLSSAQNLSAQKRKLRTKKTFTSTTSSSSPAQLRPRSAASPHLTRLSLQEARIPAQHGFDPPPYRPSPASRSSLHSQPSPILIDQSPSGTEPVSDVLSGNSTQFRYARVARGKDEKVERDTYSSDEEAINIATAGSSGSAALEERTSSVAGRNGSSSRSADVVLRPGIPYTPGTLTRSHTSSTIVPTIRNRPLQSDPGLLRSPRSVGSLSRPQACLNPSVWSVQSALPTVPLDEARATSDADGEEDGEEDGESISFAQALSESRIPGLPPPGTRQPQEAIVIGTGNLPNELQSPSRDSASDTHTTWTMGSQCNSRTPHRRWSILNGVFSNSRSMESFRTSGSPASHLSSVPTEGGARDGLTRISSVDSIRTEPHLMGITSTTRRPSTASTCRAGVTASPGPSPPMHYRFLPRIFANAFRNGHVDNHNSSVGFLRDDSSKKQSTYSAVPPPPAPKLDNIKLPGTKGAIMIKAVETAKKSFLAILCGERGEKVELFAGTYKTTLGLSRTFILPDSPRSLELQLQGDDLVEVFLVFSQNVFGLEPATVRVREVRIDRAERRAARRRARETRVEEHPSSEANGFSLEEGETTETTIGVNVGEVPSTSTTMQTLDDPASSPPTMSRQPSESNINVSESLRHATGTPQTEVATLTFAHMAPYTTFQQLSFAPQFPLATIADEFIIPPTYQSFLEYRTEYESGPDVSTNPTLAYIRFSPPGLPLPPVLPPSRWYYRDPKGFIQGPWKASLMQSWHKEGLLPPDLPVRREEDTEYILLRDLRMQSVDPTHPFRSPPLAMRCPLMESPKPLLCPISLLTQSRRYGPPALFYTTRGGHSTSIVDARGRSVLRGRLHWSNDEEEDGTYGNRLRDVKRLEAFDVGNTAVIVAIRQGGLEVTEIGDALLGPGDLSRSVLPSFRPQSSNMSRRCPFTWKVGTPLPTSTCGPASTDSNQTISKSKLGSTSGKSHATHDLGLGNSDDIEVRHSEELVFLGRVESNVYLCERSNDSYRILCLCLNAPSSSSSASSSL